MPRVAPLRARDLRANIKELGFDKGVVMTLELMLDEWVGVREQIREMSELQLTICKVVENMTVVADGIANQMNAIKNKEEQFNESRGEGILPSSN